MFIAVTRQDAATVYGFSWENAAGRVSALLRVFTKEMSKCLSRITDIRVRSAGCRLSHSIHVRLHNLRSASGRA